MSLLSHFTEITDRWKKLFRRTKSHARLVKVSVALISAYGRKTLTGASCFRGVIDTVEADYKLFKRNPKGGSPKAEPEPVRRRQRASDPDGWDASDIFEPVFLEAAKEIPEDEPVVVSMDDTCLPKTGRKIPQARYCHDPLAPKFIRGACRWGLRMLHCCVNLPVPTANAEGYRRPMAITTVFRPVPGEPKLKKDVVLTEEEMVQFEALKKEASITTAGTAAIKWHRDLLDAHGQAHRKLLVVVDGSYCNNSVIRPLPKNTDLIGRIKETATLYAYLPKKRRKNKRHVYGLKLDSPGTYYRKCLVPTHGGYFNYGGRRRPVRFMEVTGLGWKAAGDREMRLIIIRPTAYNKGGRRSAVAPGKRRPKRGYNRPAFLMTTDLTSPAEKLIQAYFDRWQIEVLHREMKTDVGIGQAQVRNELANERVHSVQAAAFAALNLAALRQYGGQWNKAFPNRPHWRKRPPMRLSAQELLTAFRNELVKSKFLIDKKNKTKDIPFDWELSERETYMAA